MTALVTQQKLDDFEIDIDLLEKGLRDHVIQPFGRVHVPNGGLAVVAGSTYKNSSGVVMGNATLQVTYGDPPTTYYVPARIIV